MAPNLDVSSTSATKTSSIPVTIGVAVRYEEPENLSVFVRQLAEAARRLDSRTESEVCFCLNGANPQTKRYLDEALGKLCNSELRFISLMSPAGKIKAHAAIARARQLHGFLLFVDADVRFDADLFVRLYDFLRRSPEVHGCYAEVEALPSVAGGLFARMQNAYYRNRKHLARGPYLHGRCFLLRSWIDDFGALCSPSAIDIDRQHENLRLQHGPIVDDIHYSRVLAHRFGLRSIVSVPGARLFFVPPNSPAELYRDSCRTELEIVRLDALFPEHALCEREHFNPRSDVSKLCDALRRAGAVAAAYVAMELLMRRVARLKSRRRLASLAEAGISPSTNDAQGR